MRKYFVAKDKTKRDAALERIKALGYTWASGDSFKEFKAISLSIGYASKNKGITQCWVDEDGKHTTIERFLIDLEIEKLKQKKRALPKLGEES